MTILYVSDKAANGISAGSDKGDGSKSHPFLTLDEAAAVEKDGDTIRLNDGVYVPTAGTFEIDAAVTIEGVTNGGATIEGVGNKAPVSIGITDGGTVTFGDVNINGRGAATNDIVLKTTPKTYTLDLDGTHLLNATGYAVSGAANIGVNINATNATYAAGTSRGMFGLSSLSAGHIDVEGGSVDIADQVSGSTKEGSGQIGSASIALVDANAPGVTVKISGVTANAEVDGKDLDGTGVEIMNVAGALVENNTIALSGSATSARDIEVTYDFLAPLDSSDAIIADNHVTNTDVGGGSLIYLGSDGSPGEPLWNYADDAKIYGNVGYGDAASEAADLHGILVGWQSGVSVDDNQMYNTGFAYVMKGDNTLSGPVVVFNNYDQDTSGKSWYQKGGTGVEWLDNASYQEQGYRPIGLYVGQDNEPNITYYASGGTAQGNTIWYAGAAPSGYFVYLTPGSSIATLDDNHYHTDGALSATPWSWTGEHYTTLATWQAAHEATATGTPVGLSFAQFLAALSDGGLTTRISVTASVIEGYSAHEIATLAADGLTTLIATDAKPDISGPVAIALAKAGISIHFPTGTALFSAATGKPYTAFESDYDAAGKLTDRQYFGITGKAYSSYEDFYNASGKLTEMLFTGVTGQHYTSDQYDYNSSGQLVDKRYFGVTDKPYSSYEDFYGVSGKITDILFTGLSTPHYTSYQYDYAAGGKLIDKQYFGVTGKLYSSYEDLCAASGKITDILFTGVTGQPYTSYDYHYNAAGHLVEKQYLGVTDKPYSSYEDLYDPSGKIAYIHYANNDGSDTFVGREAGLIFAPASLNDAFTGGEGSETFAFGSGFGKATITDFAKHLTGSSHDTLSLSSSSISSFNEMLAATTFAPSGATIHVDQDDTITLSGLTQAEMSANPGDFSFHVPGDYDTVAGGMNNTIDLAPAHFALVEDTGTPIHDTLVGFVDGTDYLSFAGATAASEQAVIDNAKVQSGTTVLTYPDKSTIALVGVSHLNIGIFF